MFISSYNTYISTNNSDKTNHKGVGNKKDGLVEFTLKHTDNQTPRSYVNNNLPIDYVSNYKSLNNQLKLQEQIKSQDEIKFEKIKEMKNAKSAYAENSQMFSLLKKPTLTLSQTTHKQTDLPQNIQEIKDSNLRNIMVNTYLENDNYYQTTA
jgi:hypothetical protein